MSDSDLETSEKEAPAAPAEETRLDEDDRLRPEYVDEVLAKLEAGDAYTTAPSVSSFSLIGLIRSSRFTPSHMATAAATNTDE